MAIIEHAGYYEDPMPGVSHEHFCCELMYITEGELDITAKETYHIYANDLVLIKSSQHHRVRVTTSAEYHRYIVMINPWELRNQLVRPDLFAMLTDTSKEGIIIVRNDPELRSGFDKMTDIFTNGANIYTELGATLEIISVVYEQIKPHKEGLIDRMKHNKAITTFTINELCNTLNCSLNDIMTFVPDNKENNE